MLFSCLGPVKYSIMNVARGYRPNIIQKRKQMMDRHQDSVLIIKIPDSRILGLISKSLFLGIIILLLPSIGSFVSDEHFTNQNDFLPMVFKDLMIEGLLKDGQKGLLLSSGIKDLFDSLWFLHDKGIDVVTDSDLDEEMVLSNEAFDFVFASRLEDAKFINRVVKIDGIVVMPLGNYYDWSYELMKQSNYKIVYLRQFDLVTFIAMRKIDDQGEEGLFSSWNVLSN